MGGLEPPTSRIRTGYSTKLSYTQAAWWYGWEDSNPRQPRPKRGALAKLSYTRMSRNVRARPVARSSALRSEASRSCWLRYRESNPNFAVNSRASYRLDHTELARRRGFEPREAGFGDRPVHQAHSARTDHYIPPYPCSYIPSAGGGGRLYPYLSNISCAHATASVVLIPDGCGFVHSSKFSERLSSFTPFR